MLKRGKFVFLMIVLLFVLVCNVNAANNTINANESAAYNWLYSKMNSTDWSGTPSEIALSILALGGEGYSVDEGIGKLKSLESGNSWGNGDIKDTSLAILALYQSGENVSSEVEWLESQHKKAMTGGKWYIQLDSSQLGTLCVLKYRGEQFKYEINGTDVIQVEPDYCTEPTNWINFLNCIKRENEPNINETIGVKCNSDSSYSVIFETPDNEYYIVDEGDPLNIENGCFYWQNSCNCEYSGYAGWVLREVKSDSFVKPYMISKCAGAKGYSFLYLMTGDSFYSDWLESNQEGGSWDGDLKTTYLGLLALKKYGKKSGDVVDSAIDYVEWYQDSDGSWNQNVEDTAFILYILYSGEFRNLPSPGGAVCGDDFVEGLEDCEKNSDCNGTGEVCSLNCRCVLGNETAVSCGDGICGLGETCFNCETDCGVCEEETPEPFQCLDNEEYNPETGQCEKKSSWFKWSVIILSILIGVAIIYFVYKKFFKKGKGGESKRPIVGSKPPYKMTSQRIPMRRPIKVNRQSESGRDSRIERELEESIKRAREILKK